MGIQIHPSSVVSPKAEIADGVQIGPYCIVDEDVTIGRDTVLRAYVHLCPFTKIGEEALIYEHAVLAPPPQDHAFSGEKSWVIVGNRSEIRENVTIHRASGEGNATRVGDDCLIMEGVHLGHNVQIADHVTISSKSGLAGYVQIGKGTVIGGMTGFHQFVRVGEYCMVGGLSRMAQDVAPFLLVNGSPCRVYNLNVIGLRRNDFSSERRLTIKRAYKKIYHSGLSVHEALKQLETEYSNDRDVLDIVKFFREGNKQRGFCPWPTTSRAVKKEEE